MAHTLAWWFLILPSEALLIKVPADQSPIRKSIPPLLQPTVGEAKKRDITGEDDKPAPKKAGGRKAQEKGARGGGMWSGCAEWRSGVVGWDVGWCGGMVWWAGKQC